MTIMKDYQLRKLWNIPISVRNDFYSADQSFYHCADPVLKEAAANAAGPNATLANLPPVGVPAPAEELEQEMKDNNENTGSQ